MATIVQMPAPRSRTTRSADPQDGAQILFFTGVRYVRDEDPTDEQPACGLDIGDPRADGSDTALALI